MDAVASAGDERWRCAVSGDGLDAGVSACVGAEFGAGGDELVGDCERGETCGVGVDGVRAVGVGVDGDCVLAGGVVAGTGSGCDGIDAG